MRWAVAVLLVASVGLAERVDAVAVSRCVGLVDQSPLFRYAAFRRVSLAEGEVRISYVTHSTFRIESRAGVTIATDYAGFAGRGVIPNIITMNHAHETHYTDFPDPEIEHVLKGWNPDGGPARHDLRLADVYVRNVSTDIRGWDGEREAEGNSIFIFEIAGLCIGHLGHLHHKLGPEHLGQIGQLDVVMVPVDGSFTMDVSSMIEVLQALKARLVLPMHAFGSSSLSAFLTRLGETFDVELSESRSIVVSQASLPVKTKVTVLPGF